MLFTFNFQSTHIWYEFSLDRCIRFWFHYPIIWHSAVGTLQYRHAIASVLTHTPISSADRRPGETMMGLQADILLTLVGNGLPYFIERQIFLEIFLIIFNVLPGNALQNSDFIKMKSQSSPLRLRTKSDTRNTALPPTQFWEPSKWPSRDKTMMLVAIAP